MPPANPTAILEALGSYQKQGSPLGDVEAVADMLGGESDRGVVIILVSFIEDALLERILRTFQGPQTVALRKNLTRAGAPLNSLSARANMALAMGLISESQAATLEQYKAMRNACAHSRRPISFETPELRNAFLLSFEMESDGTAGGLEKFEGWQLRGLFIVLVWALLDGLSDETRPQGEASPYFKDALEIVKRLGPGPTSRGTLTQPPSPQDHPSPKD